MGGLGLTKDKPQKDLRTLGGIGWARDGPARLMKDCGTYDGRAWLEKDWRGTPGPLHFTPGIRNLTVQRKFFKYNDR